MPFSRPSLPEIIERTFNDLNSRLALTGAVLRRAVVRVLARVLAGCSHMLFGHLDWISKQAIPDTATEWLARWAALWGITPKPANYATRTITITGSQNGATVPALSTYQAGDGTQFQTQADATLAGLTTTVVVKCLSAGTVGNLAIGTTLQLLFPIQYINSNASVSALGTDGTEIETPDALRSRLLTRIQQPPNGGSAADYVEWALEVPGVTRAWVYPLYTGAGTVALFFVRDNDVSIIPDAGEVAQVQAYIDARRPVTAIFTALAPIPKLFNPTIHVNPATAAVKAAVLAELTDFVTRESAPGSTLYWSRINEAISSAQGEFDHTLTVPAADATSNAGELWQMGNITWV